MCNPSLLITVLFYCSCSLLRADSSKPEILSFSVEGSPLTAVISWKTETGYDYQIQRSEDLMSNSWDVVGSGFGGVLPMTTWSISEPITDKKAFFRVSRLPPLVEGSSTSTELLQNTKFDSSAAPWFMVYNAGSGAAGTLTGGSGELKLEITNAGTSGFHIQLLHSGISLVQGEDYTFSFRVKTLSGNRDITARVQSTVSPSSNIFTDHTVSIGDTAQDFSFPFTMTSSSGASSRVAFNLGGDATGIVFECISLTTSSGATIDDRLEAHQFNTRLGKGNNFSAYMADPKFGAREDYELLRESGFSHCRIGYKLDEHVGLAPDFVVTASELDELERLVSLCLDEGLIAIVDPIHNWANGIGFNYPADLPKMLKIWNQVAERFADYPTNSVVFELLNEPHGNSGIADVTQQAVDEIRAISGNEVRFIIVSGEGFTTRQALINAFNDDEFPADDFGLIATFHYYEPKAFTTPDQAGSGFAIPWADDGPSDADFDQVSIDFGEVQVANDAWALRNNTEPLPIFLGEFGCDNIAALEDRKRWLSWVRLTAEQYGFSWSHWLMYNDTDFSKGMGSWATAERFDPSLRAFQPDAVEALIGLYEGEDATLISTASVGNDGTGSQGRGWLESDFIGAGFSENIYLPREQEYILEVKYQTGTDITVLFESQLPDGTVVDSRSVILAENVYNNSWNTVKVPLTLAADGDAFLKVTQSTTGLVRFDSLSIAK